MDYKDFDPKRCGSKIRECRDRLGFNQEDVASRINVNRARLARIELGEQDPSVRNIFALARVLDTDFVYLLS